MEILQKTVSELSNSEKEQLEALIYRYYRSASPTFIANRLEKDNGFDIVMIKNGDVVDGVGFYHLIKYEKTTRSRPHFILHFGQTMKRSGYRGNIIWRLGRWYSQRNISPVYLLHDVTAFASFISPKAFEHYTKLFPRHHFEPNTSQSKHIQNFMVEYFRDVRDIQNDYNNDFCFDSSDLGKEDITEDWDKVYRAKNERFNELFIEKGIIQKEGDRIYKMPRHITVCGVHRPLPFRKKLNLPEPSNLKFSDRYKENRGHRDKSISPIKTHP